MLRATEGRATSWVWSVPVACLAVQAAAAVGAAGSGLPEFDLDNVYPNVVFGILLPVLGAVIVRRVGHHPIGWLFLGCGLASSLALGVYTYAEYGLLLHPGSLPLALFAGWVSSWVWTLGFAPLVTVGVLLFPDGRVPGPRWRRLLQAELATIVLLVTLNMFVPGPLQNHPTRANPLGAPLPPALFSALGVVAMAMVLAGMVGSAAAAVVRWRHSTGADREQLSWFAFAAVLLVVAIVLPVPAPLSAALKVVAIPLLPLSVAVAVLRHRLYGIEVVVRRSLVYGALTTLLLLAYSVVVGGLDGLLRGRGHTSAALVGTAVVAVVFAPARSRLQQSVDHLVFGDRGNPYEVLAGVGRRLDGGDIGGDPLHEIVTSLATALRLPSVRVEVARDGRTVMTAQHGLSAVHPHEVALRYRGTDVGRLLAAPRTARDAFRPSELRLLEDLGQQIAVAAHAMLVTRELQRSRESLVTTREEERRRIRRDLHDGLGPTLAGVALGLDAVSRTAATDPEASASLAQQLKREVHASLAEVRRLVEDLRPPALDQLGLAGAVHHRARQLSERDPGLEISVDVELPAPLPAAAEVAAYRIVTEALNNVARHAHARHCTVRLTTDDGRLAIVVDDDGVGLASTDRFGVGVMAMRERATELGGVCTVTPTHEGGTRVSALIPVAAR